MPSPVAELLAALGAVLGRLGVRWYVFGAQAALLHGSARLTSDVDVTVQLGERDVVTLLDALRAGGFEMRVSDAVAFAERARVVPALHVVSGIPVDVVLGGSSLEDAFLGRAEEHVVEGVRVPVARAEDLVAMKILGGRPKDVEDAVAILAARSDAFEVALVRDTLGALEEALDRSDLLPLLDRLIERAGA